MILASSWKTRFLMSAALGCALGCLPLVVLFLFQNSPLRSPFWDNVLVIYVPGTLLGMLLNAGRIHDVTQVMAVGASCAFYTVVISAVWSFCQKRVGESRPQR
jgi:hypothetical protein